MSDKSGPPSLASHKYKGTLFPWLVSRSNLEAIPDFEVRRADIWLLTYSKSGTTWIADIVNKILVSDGIRATDDPTVDHAPYLEFNTGPRSNHELFNEAPSPRVITSHLLPQFLPLQLSEKKPKIISVARNPKDVIASYLHHFKHLPVEEDYSTIQKLSEVFMSGDIVFGEWHTHVLHWWDKRNDDNVLFLKYEDMKKDLKSSVKTIAEFIGINLDNEAINLIASQTTIEATRNREIKPKEFMLKALNIDAQQSPFVRTGVIGDWKKHFTVAQSEEFDTWYNKVMKDSDLTFQFTE